MLFPQMQTTNNKGVNMGFPIIMCLSKSKVKMFLDRKEGISFSSLKSSIGFELSSNAITSFSRTMASYVFVSLAFLLCC